MWIFIYTYHVQVSCAYLYMYIFTHTNMRYFRIPHSAVLLCLSPSHPQAFFFSTPPPPPAFPVLPHTLHSRAFIESSWLGCSGILKCLATYMYIVYMWHAYTYVYISVCIYMHVHAYVYEYVYLYTCMCILVNRAMQHPQMPCDLSVYYIYVACIHMRVHISV